jgi:hypothetical protein
MGEQTYQEGSWIIAQDLIGLYRLGVKNLNEINLKECKGDYHDYFYYRKNKHPKMYERLTFDTNGKVVPYSYDLGDIMMDFVVCGFVNPGKTIHLENIEVIKKQFNWREERLKKAGQ